MTIDNFFRFGSRLLSTTFQAHPVGLRSAGECGVGGDPQRLIKGEFDSIDFPITFQQDDGKELRDVLDTGYAGLYLISDHMRSVLESEGLTGWKTFAILLLDRKNNEIEGYNGFSVTGRCGPIDVSKSDIIEKRLVSSGPITKYYKGLFVGLDRWDGSDFFLPAANYGTIVTAKAAGVIKSKKLTNVRLTSLAEIEINEMTANLIQSDTIKLEKS